LLSELGSALYSAGKYDDATTRFEAALKLTPDVPNALEGLALVAATQRRYPQAREHLLHLLRVNPQSAANWLRLGDIEHKLGNTEEAATAWQRVLDMRAADRALRDKAEKRLKLLGPARAP
jgi:tetratricopeptide (TPR) repeat protein